MSPELTHLVTLQAIDLELAHHRAVLASLPKRLATAESALKQAETSLATTKSSLTKEESLRRSHENDIATHRTKIDRLRKQMETATSAAQISALEHEITFAESGISKLEDEELASMERTESLEADSVRFTTLVDSTTTILAETRVAASSLTDEHTAAIAALTTERIELREQIAANDAGEALLSTYDRIAKGKGTGLSEAVDHKCSACQMMVRPQRWNDLTGREFEATNYTCETCGRLLFYDTRHDTPGRIPTIDRLHSAQALSK